jgi:hypothetical protein
VARRVDPLGDGVALEFDIARARSDAGRHPCIWSGTYAALVGCVVFALYPLWRRWWRRVHPMTAERQPVDLSSLPDDDLLREIRQREYDDPGGPPLLSASVRAVFRAGGKWDERAARTAVDALWRNRE